MNEENIIKIEFISKKAGLIVIKEIFDPTNKETIIKEMKSTMSVQSFPISNLKLNTTSKYPSLISVKTGDIINIYDKDKTGIYNKFFAGFVKNVKVKSQKDDISLNIECTSEFYKLQNTILNINDFDNLSGLREIFSTIVSVSQISGKITVDEKINDTYKLNHFKNFPALALINSICYELDLIYNIDKGDIMHFSKRKDVLHKMFNSTPIIINDDKIISSEFEQ